MSSIYSFCLLIRLFMREGRNVTWLSSLVILRVRTRKSSNIFFLEKNFSWLFFVKKFEVLRKSIIFCRQTVPGGNGFFNGGSNQLGNINFPYTNMQTNSRFPFWIGLITHGVWLMTLDLWLMNWYPWLMNFDLWLMTYDSWLMTDIKFINHDMLHIMSASWVMIWFVERFWSLKSGYSRERACLHFLITELCSLANPPQILTNMKTFSIIAIWMLNKKYFHVRMHYVDVLNIILFYKQFIFLVFLSYPDLMLMTLCFLLVLYFMEKIGGFRFNMLSCSS